MIRSLVAYTLHTNDDTERAMSELYNDNEYFTRVITTVKNCMLNLFKDTDHDQNILDAKTAELGQRMV